MAEEKLKGDEQSDGGKLLISDFKMAKTDKERLGMCENKKKKNSPRVVYAFTKEVRRGTKCWWL